MAPAGLILHVRLAPKSSRDQVVGLCAGTTGGALSIRVRAVPSGGRANAALETLVAAWLHLPKSSVTLTKGSKSRTKTLQIAGKPEVLEPLMIAKLAELDA